MTKPLKIGFDAKRAFLNSTGLGSYSRNTICALCDQYPEHDYFLYTTKVQKGLFEVPENAVCISPKGAWWNSIKPIWRTYQVTELAKEAGLDIFHGLSHELPVGLHRSRIKQVVTFHDLIIRRFPHLYRAADRRIYHRKYRHAVDVADKIIAISRQTKNDLIEFMQVDESKIALLYQSINPIYFEDSLTDDREFTRLKYRLPKQFILIPGTIEKRKNQERVLKALVDHRIEMPIVVVGKQTAYMGKLKPLVRQLEGRIMFLTQVSNHELVHLYQMAELSIFMSLFEGFGLPVAEAQACGCPVLTSNRSSMPEAGGDGGFYVDPEDTEEIALGINVLLGDEATRNRHIQLGRENAERFRPELYARELMKIYQNL